MADPMTEPAIAVINLREFFHDSLQQALQHQQVALDPQAEQYLVAVLTRFARAEEFHQGTAGRRTQRPLAFLLADAVSAATASEQRERLQRLGDVSLFMAGFLANSYARKLVDIDYCIAMGGSAYGSVADSWRGQMRGAALSLMFAELAGKFQRLVDVLNEVADMAKPGSDQDLLRLYEVWLQTGSPRARKLLEERGIAPVSTRANA